VRERRVRIRGDFMVLVTRGLAIAFGLLWLYCATFNAIVTWRSRVRGKRSPSPIPLAGGIAAFLCLLLWAISKRQPVDHTLKRLWLPLVLDFGSWYLLAIPLLLRRYRTDGD
jgi:hypothetical protein